MADVFDRLKAALSDRYAIEREIGSGGMATVYLAEDQKLHRKVAVKVLKPDLAAALGPERFLQEIEIAAQLHHPHILPLHDSGDADGFLYYVMPYEEGHSLREKLAREGELPVGEAVRIVRDVVEALSHAHKHNVVHRDIKPDNVMLSEHHALVTDFGVAKAVSEATGRQQLTTAGVALGTPAYMAPEQAVADPHIDQRADIYAVGAVAYELLTGRPPFTGTTQQEILVAQVTQAPEPVTKFRESVPPALEQLVLKCLAKKAADRWQTAEELLPQLEALATPSGGLTPTAMLPVRKAYVPPARITIPAVIVLLLVLVVVWFVTKHGGSPLSPDRVVVATFDNQTGDSALDATGGWASTWITQGLLQSGLVDVVPPQTSNQASQYVRSESQAGRVTDPIRLLAEETGAARVVSGALFRVSDSIQFQSQITNANTRTLLIAIDPITCAEDRLQEGVQLLSQRVSGALATILDERLAQASGFQARPPTLEAYEEYSQGMDVFGTNPAALPHFYRAANLDTTFYLPLIYAVYTHGHLGQWVQYDSLLGVLDLRREQLSPYDRLITDALRNSMLGDREGTYMAYRRAAELSPGSRAVFNHAREARRTNRPREAVEVMMRLDPDLGAMRGWGTYWSEIAAALHMLGEYERELEVGHRAQAPLRESYVPRYIQIRALAALGQVDAVAEVLSEVQAEGDRFHSYLLRVAGAELTAHDHPRSGQVHLNAAVDWAVREGIWDDPTSPMFGYFMRTLAVAGRFDELERAARARLEIEPERADAIGSLGIAMAANGRTGEAREILNSLLEADRPYDRGVSRIWAAYIAARLDDQETAFTCLRRALDEGQSYGPELAHGVLVESLRDYPPFQELMRPKG